MKITRQALAQLTHREKLWLGLHLLLRLSSSALDLAGIYLLGITVTLISGAPMGTGFVRDLVRFAQSLGVPNYYALIAGGAGAIFVFKSILSVILNVVTARYIAKLTKVKIGTLTSKILPKTSELAHEMTQHELVFSLTGSATALFSKTLMSALALGSEIFLLFAVATFMALTNPKIFLILALGFGFLAYLLNFRVGSKTEINSRAVVQSGVASGQILYEYLDNAKQLWPLGKHLEYARVFEERYSKSLNATASLSTLSILPKVVIETALVIGLGFFVLQRSLNPDLMSASDIAVFVAGCFRLVGALLPIQGYLALLRAAGSESELALKLISRNYELEIPPPFSSTSAEGPLPVEFDHVDFRYPKAKNPVLTNFSFSLDSYGVVGLIGPSGVGKSTLADLLTGLLEPSSGEVRIDGKKASQFVRANPGMVAYVPQINRLVQGSLGANVSLSPTQEYDPELAKTALEKANLGNLLKSFDSGLEMQLGGAGPTLSGGQIQRIGLARAYYQGARIVILDEVTSSLDGESEKAVVLGIRRLAKSSTVLLITHRHEILRAQDRVLELR